MLTIRNLDDDIHRRLRVAAAERGLSMEEHARQVLARAVRAPQVGVAEPETAYGAGAAPTAGKLWYDRLRAQLAEAGFVDDLVVPPREPGARPLPFEDEDF